MDGAQVVAARIRGWEASEREAGLIFQADAMSPEPGHPRVWRGRGGFQKHSGAARTGAFLDVGDEAEDAWVSDMGMGVNAKMEALYVLRGVMSPQLASEQIPRKWGAGGVILAAG